MDKAMFIRSKRLRLRLSRKDFARLLDLTESGERIVDNWECGASEPSASKMKSIISLPDLIPFQDNGTQVRNFNFIDLFAGIGGMRLAFQGLGGRCVFSSEWNKFSQKTYAANFGEFPEGDITKIPAVDIPDHDILLAGFPCQAFSQAGRKLGFYDTRGTMFFEIQRILATKRPKAFLLENVKQLKGHNKGQTLRTILKVLRGESHEEIPADIPVSDEARAAFSSKLNYSVGYKILRAGDFGVPQNRERIFIVGFDRDCFNDKSFEEIFFWPREPKTPTRVGDILEDSSTLPARYTISSRIWEGHQRRKLEHRNKGNGFGYSLFNKDSNYTNTISARYYKDGTEALIDQSDIGKNPRVLTPRECARLQGFPEEFVLNAVSDCQAYRQLGNSVAVPVITAIAKQIVKTMGYLKSTEDSVSMNSGELRQGVLMFA